MNTYRSSGSRASRRLLTLFEHQFYPYDSIDFGPGGLNSREKVLIEIERLNHAYGQDILRLDRKGLRATQQVGVIRAGELTIEILPKVDYKLADTDSATRSEAGGSMGPALSAARNLLVMLSYTCGIRLDPQTIVELSSQASGWLELLTRLFTTQLYSEILSGISHNYVTRAETLPVLRGRWDLQRQILRHFHDRHQFDVVHDDYSPDIPLNQVFRFVIEQLYGITQDSDNRILLNDLRQWFQNVTLLPKLTPAFADGVQFSRLNERFLPVFNLARLFLSTSSLYLRAGDRPLFGFVLDMPGLFERFVTAFLQRNRQTILPKIWQDVNIVPQAEGTRIFLASSGGQNILRLRPDILFTRTGQPAPLLIADIKYKLLAPSRHMSGVAEDDVYQMLAYAVRLRCPSVLMIFPQPEATGPLRIPVQIEQAGVRLWVSTIQIRAPLEHPAALTGEMREIVSQAARMG